MSRISKFLVTGFLALAALAPIASAQRFVTFRGGFYGPAFYGPGYGYGWYGPGWGPYGYGYASAPSTGSVKFNTKMKDAAVYVDGGYAGTVDQLKTFKLRPGEHNLELKAPDGHSFYQEHVNVIAGKTLKINP